MGLISDGEWLWRFFFWGFLGLLFIFLVIWVFGVGDLFLICFIFVDFFSVLFFGLVGLVGGEGRNDVFVLGFVCFLFFGVDSFWKILFLFIFFSSGVGWIEFVLGFVFVFLVFDESDVDFLCVGFFLEGFLIILYWLLKFVGSDIEEEGFFLINLLLFNWEGIL